MELQFLNSKFLFPYKVFNCATNSAIVTLEILIQDFTIKRYANILQICSQLFLLPNLSKLLKLYYEEHRMVLRFLSRWQKIV